MTATYTPPGKGKPREDRQFDRTYLSERRHGRLVHRDYAAHFFRWGFARRFCGPGGKVLDVGCGPEIPLKHVLLDHGDPGQIPATYVGVDLNKLPETGNQHVTLYPGTNFLEAWETILATHGVFDTVTCFEVIEHMTAEDGLLLAVAIKNCLAPRGVALVSTPVLGGRGQARNHIHEYSVQELFDLFLRAGLRVEGRHGTFANLPAIRKELRAEADDRDLGAASLERARGALQLLDDLGRYYSNDVLSCFLAPLYPDQSRNNIWLLRRS